MMRIIGILTIFVMGSAQAAEHFLNADELARLTPHPDVNGASRYLSEGVDESRYNRRIIGSIAEGMQLQVFAHQMSHCTDD